MKQLAFYAPLKSPDHAVPSGDREIAQSIMTALATNSLGLELTLASQLRCYDGQGDKSAQQKIRDAANAEVERILDSGADWQAWVTYHNYYKAPDLIGLAVSRQLNIPYMLIEASIAKSRLNGPWADFAVSADAATASADVVFYLTEKDRVALAKYQSENQKLVHLAPFLNLANLPEVPAKQRNKNQLLAVGMHRYGDKLESYRIIAKALSNLETNDWQLQIIGDGPARTEIESMFVPYGRKVKFLGQCDRDEVTSAYQQASVFVWPGVNEAFGMVYLEAQATGLPVVAQDRAGVREVIASSQSLQPVGDPQSIARTIDRLLANPSEYHSMAQAGRDFISSRHLLGSAASTLSEQLSELIAS